MKLEYKTIKSQEDLENLKPGDLLKIKIDREPRTRSAIYQGIIGDKKSKVSKYKLIAVPNNYKKTETYTVWEPIKNQTVVQDDYILLKKDNLTIRTINKETEKSKKIKELLDLI